VAVTELGSNLILRVTHQNRRLFGIIQFYPQPRRPICGMVWHKLRSYVRLLVVPLVLAFGAVMAFKFYKSSANEQDG
jgi:hypothetical protein